jgi:hypothetical protein
VATSGTLAVAGLADGKIVRLEKLGSLYATLSSKGAELEENFATSTMIEKVNVRYRPGKRIVDSVKNAGFKKTS